METSKKPASYDDVSFTKRTEELYAETPFPNAILPEKAEQNKNVGDEPQAYVLVHPKRRPQAIMCIESANV